jgi:hypothetical protein
VDDREPEATGHEQAERHIALPLERAWLHDPGRSECEQRLRHAPRRLEQRPEPCSEDRGDPECHGQTNSDPSQATEVIGGS